MGRAVWDSHGRLALVIVGLPVVEGKHFPPIFRHFVSCLSDLSSKSSNIDTKNIEEASSLLRKASDVLASIIDRPSDINGGYSSAGSTTSSGSGIQDTVRRARTMMGQSSKSGLYRRLNQSERLRATGNSSKAKNKVRTAETKAFEFCLLNSVDDEEGDGEQTLVKENIIERGIIMLSESDSEVEIRKNIVSSLREKYPIFGASDFEFVTQKKISILNLAKGMEYNYGVVKKLVGQGNLYVQIKRGFQFVLESEEEEEKEEEKELLTSSFSLSTSLKEKDKGANPSQGSTTCIQPQDNLQQVKDGQENAFSALSNDMPSNITDPTEMLRYLQKKIVNGRALEVIDPSVVMEGETNFIAVDRDNIIETTFDEIKGIKDPSITFKVQFYGENAVDSGGPRKEWIRLFNQDTKQKYFDHGLKEHLAEDYFYIGQMAAIALLQNGQIPRYFPEECLQDIFVNEKKTVLNALSKFRKEWIPLVFTCL
ncbi:hypothetical protein QZH41_007449 [Actinostola sp. cb2023]|nr:hypothetical protein QZH41_007449 [Actinostola sp. cb2023]